MKLNKKMSLILPLFLVGIVFALTELGSSVHSYKNVANPTNVLYENTAYSTLQYLYAGSSSDCATGFTFSNSGKYCVADGAGVRGWEVIDFNSSEYTYNITVNASDFDISCSGKYCDQNGYPYVLVFVANESFAWDYLGSISLDDLSYQVQEFSANQDVRYVLIGRDGGGSARPDPAVHYVKRSIANPDLFPTATANANPTSGLENLYVQFTGNVVSGDAPFTYLWNFTDGTTSTSQNPNHTFTAGTYEVSFTVTDNDGDYDTDFVTITVEQDTTPSVSAFVFPTSGSSPLFVNFTASVFSGNAPYTWLWTFGDGSNSTNQYDYHVYNGTGNYTATVKVTDNDGDYDIENVLIMVW